MNSMVVEFVVPILSAIISVFTATLSTIIAKRSKKNDLEHNVKRDSDAIEIIEKNDSVEIAMTVDGKKVIFSMHDKDDLEKLISMLKSKEVENTDTTQD